MYIFIIHKYECILQSVHFKFYIKVKNCIEYRWLVIFTYMNNPFIDAAS